MKFFVSIFIIAVVATLFYFYSSNRNKKTKKKGLNKRALAMTAIIVVFLLWLLAFGMYKAGIAPDTWCTTTHTTASSSPKAPKTAMDYFLKGDYDYDIGDCKQAIVDYTISIRLNSKYPQAYNNRAYTFMRLKDYKDALPDLDKALELNPNYMQALMNRGDIHNYYLVDRQKAIVDYRKVIGLGGTQGTSVCGHLFLAKHNGWNLGTVLDIPFGLMNNCR